MGLQYNQAREEEVRKGRKGGHRKYGTQKNRVDTEKMSGQGGSDNGNCKNSWKMSTLTTSASNPKCESKNREGGTKQQHLLLNVGRLLLVFLSLTFFQIAVIKVPWAINEALMPLCVSRISIWMEVETPNTTSHMLVSLQCAVAN